MKQQEYSINGLHCTNCAAKIEEEIRNMAEVRSARLNFATQILKVEFHSPQDEGMSAQLSRLADSIEPGVTLTDGRDSAGGTENQSTLAALQLPAAKAARFLTAGGLFAAALIAPAPLAVTYILFGLAYLLSGGDVLLKAARGMLRRSFFDENVLMSVATLGAWGIGETAEAVAVMLFYQLGEIFQEAAVNRSRRSIRSLMDLKPEMARLKEGAEFRETAPEEVEVESIIQVRPGEKIPLDGIILEGEAVCDTSALTGESMPRTYVAGQEILSGIICQDGLLTIRVTKTYESSTVARIMEMVEDASDRKAPVENFITKFAKVYTPAVFAGAALTFLIPTLLGGDPQEWFYRALVFLVISCPCALVVSIPLGIFAGIGSAGRRGILVKGGNYLDVLAGTETVVFDKTGTLTEGRFSICGTEAAEGFTADQLLEATARAEAGSNHPLARAVLSSFPVKEHPASFREIRGRGIEAHLSSGETVISGSEAFLREQNISGVPESSSEEGKTALYTAVNGRYAGRILLEDRLKSDAADAVSGLKKLGIKRTVMLTGDTPAAAAPAARQLGMTEVYAGLLPEDKVNRVEEIKEKSAGSVVFLGDGINDAPVLALADAGVAMGGLGSDIAIEAADAVIMNDKPSRMVDVIRIARKTRRIVTQNIVLALGIKLAVLLLGALGFASLWAAVFADVGAALLAIFNALRILRFKEAQ